MFRVENFKNGEVLIRNTSKEEAENLMDILSRNNREVVHRIVQEITIYDYDLDDNGFGGRHSAGEASAGRYSTSGASAGGGRMFAGGASADGGRKGKYASGASAGGASADGGRMFASGASADGPTREDLTATINTRVTDLSRLRELAGDDDYLFGESARGVLDRTREERQLEEHQRQRQHQHRQHQRQLEERQREECQRQHEECQRQREERQHEECQERQREERRHEELCRASQEEQDYYFARNLDLVENPPSSTGNPTIQELLDDERQANAHIGGSRCAKCYHLFCSRTYKRFNNVGVPYIGKPVCNGGRSCCHCAKKNCYYVEHMTS